MKRLIALSCLMAVTCSFIIGCGGEEAAKPAAPATPAAPAGDAPAGDAPAGDHK